MSTYHCHDLCESPSPKFHDEDHDVHDHDDEDHDDPPGVVCVGVMQHSLSHTRAPWGPTTTTTRLHHQPCSHRQ